MILQLLRQFTAAWRAGVQAGAQDDTGARSNGSGEAPRPPGGPAAAAKRAEAEKALREAMARYGLKDSDRKRQAGKES